MFNRRELAGAALVPFIGAVAPPSHSTPQAVSLRVRRDIATLSARSDTIVAFRDGIRSMRRRPAEDPLSWEAHRRRHAMPRWGQHRTWRFFPWHRAQLLYFERIIQHESGKADFALPYFNWERDMVPSPFFGPLAHAGRRGGIARQRISRWADEQDWDFFNAPTLAPFHVLFGSPDSHGAGETQGHGIVHTFIGGDMMSIGTAPADPLFWCHHANVDRVWAAWHARNGGFARGDHSYDPAWLNLSVEGFVDVSGEAVPLVPVRSLLETEDLGYRYQDLNVVSAMIAPPRRNTAEPIYRTTYDFIVETVNRAWLWLPDALLAHVAGAGFDQLRASVVAQLANDDNCKLSLWLQDGEAGTPLRVTSAYPVPMGMGDHEHGHGVEFALAAEAVVYASQNMSRPILRIETSALGEGGSPPQILAAAYRQEDRVIYREPRA